MPMTPNIADIRNEYIKHNLNKDCVEKHPVDQFKLWFKEAMKANVSEVNAMTLSTVTIDNKPTGRIVLLKGVDNGRFIFYTNYRSQKGIELDANPFASLTIFWAELERQVRIEGKVERVSSEISDAYFSSRPKGSQIGAVTSPQSTPIANREILEKRALQIEEQYKNTPVPRPAQWGGYGVIPRRIEFWQGRASRLHDRIVYELNENQEWNTVRLAP